MFRQSEVEDLDQAVFGEEQILGLQIAMSDAFRVRRRQPARDLDGIIDGLANGQRVTGQPLSQRLAFQQLGGDVKHAALGTGIVDDHDVGVIERRRRAPFLLEPANAVGIAGESSRKNLQRNLTTQPRIASAVHLAHAARADRRKNLVGSQTRAGG